MAQCQKTKSLNKKRFIWQKLRGYYGEDDSCQESNIWSYEKISSGAIQQNNIFH